MYACCSCPGRLVVLARCGLGWTDLYVHGTDWIQAAKGVSAAYDSIADMLAQVEHFMKRLEEYMKDSVNEKLQKIAVGILATYEQVSERPSLKS